MFFATSPHGEPMAMWALAVYEASHKTIAAGTPPLTRQSTDAFLETLFFMVGEVAGQQVAPEQKLKDDWATALAANYPNMSAELKQQIAGMPLFEATMHVTWPTLPDGEKAKYRAQWAAELKPLLPAPDPAPGGATGTTTRGKRSVAEMMAEQNRRHQAYMSMSSAMMNSYRISYNTQANFSGNPWRYW